MNSIEKSTIRSPSGKDEICAKIIIDDITTPFVFHGITIVDELYTLSFHVCSESLGSVSVESDSFDTGMTWTYCATEFTATSENLKLYFTTPGTYYIYRTQLELGNKDTDWTPNPDDIEEDILNVKTMATQTATMFNWLVQGNADDVTSLTLTSTMAELITESLIIKDASGSSTIISGGRMDIDEIFAHDITATGTITGVKLIGATGEFTGNISASSGNFGFLHIAGDMITSISNSEFYPNSWMQLSPRFIILEDTDTKYTTYFHSNGIEIRPISGNESVGDVIVNIGRLTTPPLYIGSRIDGGYEQIFSIESNGDTIIGKNASYIEGTALTVSGTIRSVGDVTIDKSENGADNARLVLMNSLREARLYVGSNGDIGLYDATNNKYLISSPAGGTQLNVTVPIQMSASASLKIGSGSYKQGAIELYATTPFIDFHGGSTTNDYTYRIIERGTSSAPHLSIEASGTAGRVTLQGGSYAVTMGSGFEASDTAFLPVTRSTTQPTAADAKVYLGASASRWNRVFASVGTIQTSDERDKDIIGNITQNYLDVFMELSPILYRWKDFDKDIIHMGLGAQSVERALWNHGLTIKEFGSVEHDDWSNSDIITESGRTDRYGMNYAELSILTMAVVQDHEMRLGDIEYINKTQKILIEQLLDENALLKKRVEQLENKLTF